MGGISSSTLLQNQDEPFARWRGVCRVDGGGFCGVRTLPFREKLQVDFAEGLYVKCRLSSDKDTDKRVWKITTRTEESRGEQLYQAMFDIPPPLLDDDDDDDDNVEWATVQIPFSNFTLVRGARKVKDGKPFDAENGIFQIGFTMSKFKIGENMTELEGFRPGFFELQFKEIGLYSRSPVELVGGDLPNTVNALSKAEALQKRPLMLKILSPIFKIVFLTEKQKRRQAAVKQLTEKRGMSRWRATRLGVKWRVKQQGLFKATFNLTRIVVGDALRLLLRSILRYGVFFPLRFFNQAIATVKKILKMSSVKVEQQEKS